MTEIVTLSNTTNPHWEIVPLLGPVVVSLLKFNENHDEQGRFSSDENAGGPKTESEAKTVFYSSLRQQFPEVLSLYHETPGDHAEAIYTGGLGEEGQATFATIGQTSNFVNGDKTITRFRVSARDYKKIVPDMRYGNEKKGPYQDLLSQHPKLVGADVSFARNVTPHEIISTKFVPATRKVLKYNENHDEQGRFSSDGDAGGAKELANFKETSKAFIASLSASERDALKTYSGKTGFDINSALRSGDDSKFAQTIKDMDSGVQKYQVPTDTLTYRGISEAHVGELAVGRVFSDKAFVSTAADIKGAYNFMRGDGKALLQITLPKGTNAAPISQLANRKSEKELLLGRSHSFEVTKVERKSFATSTLGYKAYDKTGKEILTVEKTVIFCRIR